MSENQIEIMGLAETNIYCNPSINKKAQKLLRTQYRHCVLINSTSDELSTYFHKPGGVSLAIAGNAVGTISRKNIDDKGLSRWVYTILNAKHNRKIVIIAAYRVCQNSLPRGHETAYSQKYQLLRKRNIINPKLNSFSITTSFNR